MTFSPAALAIWTATLKDERMSKYAVHKYLTDYHVRANSTCNRDKSMKSDVEGAFRRNYVPEAAVTNTMSP